MAYPLSLPSLCCEGWQQVHLSCTLAHARLWTWHHSCHNIWAYELNLTLHSSFNRDKPLTRIGWIDIQAPVSVLLVVNQESNTSVGLMREDSSTAALTRLDAWAGPCTSGIAIWWSTMTRDVPSRRESARTEVHILEVVWFSLADLSELGMPTPDNLTGEGEEGTEGGRYGGRGGAN